MSIKNQRAFTLIELLVVISIIGLLTTMVVAALNSARVKARDTKRRVDIIQISKALELYFDTYQTYPSEVACDSSTGSCGSVCPCGGNDWSAGSSIVQELKNEGIMSQLPKDPINNSIYFYEYENCGDKSFMLRARLETGGYFNVFRGSVDEDVIGSQCDFDHDGDVDGSDLAVFSAAYDGAYNPMCDFDNDGDVDDSDLAFFSSYFGKYVDCYP